MVLIGMGEFFVILVVGIDFLVGVILVFFGMVIVKLMLVGVDLFFAVMIGGVLVGGVLGVINGCLVNWMGLYLFIIIFGINVIFCGIMLVIFDVNLVYGFLFDFVNFFVVSVIGIFVFVIFLLIVVFIFWFLIMCMRFGCNIYVLGGNKNLVFYFGIDVKFYILVVFIIFGVCVGLVGVVLIVWFGVVELFVGMGFEIYVIVSVIIGGISFFGGKGCIFFVVIGGLIIGIINNGLNIL